MPQQQQQQLLAHKKALAHFDAAVADSNITYSPTTPITHTDNNFKFQFLICPQILHKPQLPADSSPTETPKSDISQPPSLHITDLPPAHTLKLNAYPILRPSYLLLTTSSLRRQSSPLSLADITVARTTLTSLSPVPSRENNESDSEEEEEEEGRDYMVMYNSGREAGCSRFHKHMQILPRPSVASFPLFPDRPPEDPVNVPYIYELIRHPPSPSSSSNTLSQIFTSYISSLNHFRALLGIRCEDQPVPHNVLMTQEWTVVIPRRRAQAGGLSANAAGMMGLVWVGTEGEMERWKREGAWRVLGELGLESERKTL
ncbi:MAG: hypothetical protein M1836_004100 [Candelina mexicana]|nr:MAG: hypothetical protein M1836_004100 [Candelina mexicana]